MNLEEAKEIVAKCLRNRFAIMSRASPVPPLPDCSLEDMLVANRMVDNAIGQLNPDGTTIDLTTVYPTGLAASYTLQQYGGNPFEALEAMGFLLSSKDYEICRSCRLIDRRGALKSRVKGLPLCANCFEILREADNAEKETAA